MTDQHAALRRLRDVVVACAAACLGLAVIAAALISLTGTDSMATGPVVWLLGGGQVLALAAALIGVWGFRAGLHEPADEVVRRISARLAWVQRATLVWCVAAAAIYTLMNPGAGLVALLLGAVSAQLAVLIGLLRRRLQR